MSDESGPDPLVDLEERGRALWLEVTQGRDLDGASAVLLLNACRIADRLDELAAEIGGCLTVTNDKGDEIASPLLTEHRQQLLAFNQILKSLGIGKLSERKAEEVSFLDNLRSRPRTRQPASANQQSPTVLHNTRPGRG